MSRREAKRLALWTAAQAIRGDLDGAVEVTWRELGKMIAERRQRGAPYKEVAK